MKIVAEADHQFRIVAADRRFQNAQGGKRVVGREHHAASREGRSLFQMQIGNDECSRLGQIEAAERIADRFDAVDDGARRNQRAVCGS
ncbi:hypothetical protein D9M72_643000 [compost metagenome]